jgi:hypothetical protein
MIGPAIFLDSISSCCIIGHAYLISLEQFQTSDERVLLRCHRWLEALQSKNIQGKIT